MVLHVGKETYLVFSEEEKHPRLVAGNILKATFLQHFVSFTKIRKDGILAFRNKQSSFFGIEDIMLGFFCFDLNVSDIQHPQKLAIDAPSNFHIGRFPSWTPKCLKTHN